jgi:hypothetical protein
MAYFLTCVHEFHDHKHGRVIKRGEIIDNPEDIARYYHLDNRNHHFVKVAKLDAETQWEWPPEHPDELKKKAVMAVRSISPKEKRGTSS